MKPRRPPKYIVNAYHVTVPREDERYKEGLAAFIKLLRWAANHEKPLKQFKEGASIDG